MFFFKIFLPFSQERKNKETSYFIRIARGLVIKNFTTKASVTLYFIKKCEAYL